MIHIAETVTVGSVEGFLGEDDRARLATVMNGFLTDQDSARFGAGRTTSIHEIPGHSHEQAMAVYEPAGRVEIPQIPAEAEKLLQDAFDRARPALSRVMPSITTCRPWTYVEYGPGQHITGYLDSLTVVALTVHVEEVLGVPITDTDLFDPRFATIEGMAELITQHALRE